MMARASSGSVLKNADAGDLIVTYRAYDRHDPRGLQRHVSSPVFPDDRPGFGSEVLGGRFEHDQGLGLCLSDAVVGDVIGGYGGRHWTAPLESPTT
jgi:hypothetical protein